MSKIEELIQQYCPDGVEYMPLYSITEQFSGMTGVSNKWAESGNCMFIDYMNVYKHISVDTSALKYATVKSLNQNTLMKGDILFTSASETPDECALSAVIETDIQEGIFLDDHLFGLRLLDEYRTLISPSYLKYAFRSPWFRSQVRKVVRGVTRNYVSKTDFMKLTIPVPPLPVQEEIVRILDTLTELQAELQAELQKRLQQYEYYRDKLLSFSDLSNWGGQEVSVEWKKLGEITTILRGKRLTKSQLSNDKPYAVYHGGLEPLGYYESANRTANTTMIINVGASAGTIGYSKEDFWSSDGCYCVEHSKLFDDRYIYYALQTKEQQLKSKVRVAGIPTLDKPVVEDLLVPIPPLAEQQRIVDILDRFSTLTTDLTAGLPAEIAARRKQYEYYRDQLLTFKQK